MEYDSILDSISDGVFTVGQDWRVTSFNRAAEEITGIRRDQAIGRLCAEVFRSSMCETGCALRRTLETGRPIIGRSCYIVDSSGDRVPISLSTAVLRDSEGRVIGGAETFRDLSEIEILRQELEGRTAVGDLTTHSPLMRRILDILPAVAGSSSTVLIAGETGTGKELLARTIHSLSTRSNGPFVAVNCGALPDTLLESELFGCVAGAYTGADRSRPGRFQAADGGTLLLDEISETSPALQVKLLRVIQERTFEPLGSSRSRRTDVRLIAATNRDLAQEVRQGRMREDLYYRINVIRIEIPPLRRRKEDIPLLADHFISRFNALQNRSVEGLHPEALSLMMAYDWPGNVRELENAIERAFVLCRRRRIGIDCLPETLSGAAAPGGSGLGSSLDSMERTLIRSALARTGSIAGAAAELGIHRTTLHRKMKRLGMEGLRARKQ